MTVEELEKATGKELIEERDYCGVDGYRGDYLDEVNAEMLKRFNRFAELEKEKCKLLGIIQGKDEVIANLKEQNKDLCESLDIMNNRESELLDQIVKMKNRLNCTKYHYCLCNNKTCKTCKDWELEK